MGFFFRPVARRPSIFWRSLAKVGAKMVKITSKMRQDGAKMGVSGSTFDDLSRSWPQVGGFWEVLGSILEVFWEMGESVKSNNTTAFWQDLRNLGCTARLYFSMFWEVGAKMGPRSTFFAQDSDLGGQVGAKMVPKHFPGRVQSRGKWKTLRGGERYKSLPRWT